MGRSLVSRPQRLPQALSFDEFKGDTGGQPFQCIVADPLNRRVFDILPDRTALTIQEYLRSFPNRDEVKYAVMDMNRGFRNIARTFLPNAQIIIDRFHVVRCCTEAMENARRSFQSSLPREQRRYFKRSRRLLLAHRDRLSDEDCAAVDVMLRFSDRLLQAYALKEAFYHFMDAPDRPTALRRLDFWLDACGRLELPEFKSCRKTLVNWKPYILNAFDFRLSNGFTEGCNNAIKTLKRVAFGFRNFRSFRARILLSLGPYPQHLTKSHYISNSKYKTADRQKKLTPFVGLLSCRHHNHTTTAKPLSKKNKCPCNVRLVEHTRLELVTSTLPV